MVYVMYETFSQTKKVIMVLYFYFLFLQTHIMARSQTTDSNKSFSKKKNKKIKKSSVDKQWDKLSVSIKANVGNNINDSGKTNNNEKKKFLTLDYFNALV